MTQTIDPRDLSRGQQQRLQRNLPRFNGLAEELVGEVYDLKAHGEAASWWDVVSPDTGSKFEVKSTTTEIGQQYQEAGRFRLWEDQTDNLLDEETDDDDEAAWYVFVLYRKDAGEIVLQRRTPSTVAEIVEDRGGWNKSGHENRGRQHKLPYSAVID